MPKTKDAFAFRDFDIEFIFSRPQVKLNIFEPVAVLIGDIAVSIKDNIRVGEYREANGYIAELGTYLSAIEKYLVRIKKHEMKVFEYYHNTNKKFLSNEIAPDVAKGRLQRAVFIITRYKEILSDISELANRIGKMIAVTKHEVTGKYRETFSERLRDVRKKKGFTQAEMAKRLDLSVAAYTRYENNDREPSLANLAKIATLLGTSIDYLVGLK